MQKYSAIFLLEIFLQIPGQFLPSKNFYGIIFFLFFFSFFDIFDFYEKRTCFVSFENMRTKNEILSYGFQKNC